jgi:TonB family protein
VLRALLVAGVLACLWPNSATAQSNPDAVALLQRAADQENLRMRGSPAFELHASLQLVDGMGKEFSGSYLLLWSSEDQWREELQIANYRRVRVGAAGKYWQARNITFEIPFAESLSRALDFPFLLSFRAKEDVSKIKLEKIHGKELKCIQVRSKDARVDRFCFDPTIEALRQDELEESSTYDPIRVTSRDYSDFVIFGSKTFPKTIRLDSEGSARILFTVDKLDALRPVIPNAFTPPTGSLSWETCPTILPAYLRAPSHVVVPRYPKDAIASHIQGSVTIYGLIGPDGGLSHLKIVASPSQALADAAVDAVGRWRYDPLECNGVPVTQEVFIPVTFTVDP